MSRDKRKTRLEIHFTLDELKALSGNLPHPKHHIGEPLGNAVKKIQNALCSVQRFDIEKLMERTDVGKDVKAGFAKAGA